GRSIRPLEGPARRDRRLPDREAHDPGGPAPHDRVDGQGRPGRVALVRTHDAARRRRARYPFPSGPARRRRTRGERVATGDGCRAREVPPGGVRPHRQRGPVEGRPGRRRRRRRHPDPGRGRDPWLPRYVRERSGREDPDPPERCRPSEADGASRSRPRAPRGPDYPILARPPASLWCNGSVIPTSVRVMSDEGHPGATVGEEIGLTDSGTSAGAPAGSTVPYKPPSARGRMIAILAAVLVITNVITGLSVFYLAQPATTTVALCAGSAGASRAPPAVSQAVQVTIESSSSGFVVTISPPYKTTQATIKAIGPWAGPEATPFLRVLENFTRITGIPVQYQNIRQEDLRTILPTQFAS